MTRATACGPLLLTWAGVVAGDLRQAGIWRREAMRRHVTGAERRAALLNAWEWAREARRVRRSAVWCDARGVRP